MNKNPGIKKSNTDHNSTSLFSIGVPESANLCSEFNCFTDYLDMDIDESAGIDYTLEYILCGKSGDKENLEQTISSQAARAEGSTTILTGVDSSESKCEALNSKEKGEDIV